MPSLAFDKAIGTGGAGVWEELLYEEGVSQQFFLPPVESGRHIGLDYQELLFNFRGQSNLNTDVGFMRIAYSSNWDGTSGSRNVQITQCHNTMDTYRGGYSSDPYTSYNFETSVYYIGGSRPAQSNQECNITIRMSLAAGRTSHRPRVESFCQFYDSQYSDNMMTVGYGFYRDAAISNSTNYNTVGFYLSNFSGFTGNASILGLRVNTL